MAADIKTITELLDATLDPKQHRKAENALKFEEKKPSYCLQLLNIVSSDANRSQTRQAASLAFKNYIRTNYVDEDGNHKLPQDEVTQIKQALVGLMISSPPNIQAQLGDAISIIADSDFWERWDTLIPDLVSKLSPTDSRVTNGVLEVAHSIFARWRPLFPSNALYAEVNHVLATFGEPFVQMLSVADKQIDENASNAVQLKGWFAAMTLLVKILYDLCCQDLPPIIETHLPALTGLLNKYIQYTNPIFNDADEDEASPLETLKADICELLQLFTTKYDDDFNTYTGSFTESVWNLLTTVGPEKRYDLLVSKALHFLTAVAASPRHAQAFSNEETLGQVVEKVILPNVALRESDIEMFEDEPIEFIRRDLEGSDTDSRRRAATDFLRKLLEKFESLVTQVVFRYIEHYLTLGKTDWKAKDTAIYLYLAIAAQGTVTAAQGVKSVNSNVNVVDFFQQNVASDLVAERVEPISKVDAIKYLHNFRSQLTKEQWQGAFQPLIQNLASSNYVVYTYAAIAVERVLFLTNDAGEHVFSRADIEPYANGLLEHLFTLVEKDTDPAKMQENEFLMRCVMRVLVVIKDGARPHLDTILGHLIAITNAIKSNPSNPRFYYYLFEAIGALVRFCAPTDEQKLATLLWQPFFSILNEDVSEFIPYVFQIFAALLEADASKPIPANFDSLLGPILAPTIWDTRGNVPACARFLSAIIPKARAAIIANAQLEQILGIFQKLLPGKTTAPNAFDILDAVVMPFQATELDPYFQSILNLLYTRLQANPSDTFKQRFVRFYHLVSGKGQSHGFGADYFIKQTNAIQAGMFTPVYLTIILNVTPQLARPVDRKAGVISYTKTLCDSTAFANEYKKGWGFTCNNLLDLLKNPPQVTKGFGEDLITEADVDDVGFGMGFTPLTTCKKAAKDDFPEVTDVQSWVGQYMKEANTRHNGALATFVQERTSPEAQAALAPYLA